MTKACSAICDYFVSHPALEVCNKYHLEVDEGDLCWADQHGEAWCRGWAKTALFYKLEQEKADREAGHCDGFCTPCRYLEECHSANEGCPEPYHDDPVPYNGPIGLDGLDPDY